MTVGVVAFGTLQYGANMFTSDGSVVQAVEGAAPAVLGSVIQVILTIALDGAMRVLLFEGCCLSGGVGGGLEFRGRGWCES